MPQPERSNDRLAASPDLAPRFSESARRLAFLTSCTVIVTPKFIARMQLAATNRVFRTQAFHSISDILVVGERRLGNLDDIGESTVAGIRRALRALHDSFEWEPEPDAAYAAQLCRDLDRVPVHVVSSTLHRNPSNAERRITVADALNPEACGLDIPDAVHLRARDYAEQFTATQRAMQ